MRRALPLVALALYVTACGGSKSPTAPSTTPTPTPTKIIRVEGSMGFGAVEVGASKTNTLTVYNDGNSTLTVSGMLVTSGLGAVIGAAPQTASIAPAGKQDITVRFTPADAVNYSGSIQVTADHTSGTNTIGFSGSGVRTGPLWTQSGVGDSVFDMPTYIRRVRITGTPSTSCQNFIVRIAGSTVVNVILGTCSVADTRTHDGTYLTNGGVTQITIASGVSWSFTEVR